MKLEIICTASEIKIFDKFLGSDQVEKQGNTCKRNIPARMMEEDLVERGGGKGKFLGPWETRFPRPFERIVHGTRLPRYRRLKISPTAIFNVPLTSIWSSEKLEGMS